jgi:succinoglycan biosynthesis protein ExoO
MTRPDISVVIPCYNGAAHVGRAIASALAQQGAGAIEVVVVDDCSTDGSLQLVQALAGQDPRIIALCNARNMGPGGTRNAAIAAATGQWVALLDADDAFAPGRLARLLAIAADSGADIVADLPILYDLAADTVAPTQLRTEGGWRRLTAPALMEPDPVSGLDLGLMKPIFRRTLASRGLWRYEDVRHGEDFALYLALLLKGEAIVLLHEAHYIFSARLGEVSGRFSPGSVTDVDYTGLARRSLELADRFAAEPGGEQLAALLRARADRVRSANRRYGWTVFRKGEWRRLSRWLAQDSANLGTLLTILRAKAMGHRGKVGDLE